MTGNDSYNLRDPDSFDITQRDKDVCMYLKNAVMNDNIEQIKLILDQLDKVKSNVKARKLDSGSANLLITEFAASKYLIGRGSDVSKTNNNGDTALIIAARLGSDECVKFFLEQKCCNVDAINKFGNNALFEGMKHPEIAKILIDLINLSHMNNDRANALHITCCRGSIETVKILLERGNFNVNVPNIYGETPVQMAISRVYFDLVEYLIEKGASMIKEDKDGLCGLQHVILYDESETFIEKFTYDHSFPFELYSNLIKLSIKKNKIKTLKTLISKFQVINGIDGRQLTNIGFHNLISKMFFEAYSSGKLEVIWTLLPYFLDFPEKLAESLMKTIERNDLVSYNLIFENIPTTTKLLIQDILIDHVKYGIVIACKVLLQQRIDPNRPDIKACFLEACSKGNFEIVRLLVEYGVDINSDFDGTALLKVICVGNNEALDMIKINEYLEIAEYLLEKGADPTLANSEGFTPLICASFSNSFRFFSVIFEKDKNIHKKTSQGYNPFSYACCGTNVDIVRTLVEAGADPNEIFEKNRNCLHLVAKKTERLENLIYLLGKIKNLDEMLRLKDENGVSPLQLIMQKSYDSVYFSALINERPEICKYLELPERLIIENGENNDVCSICREDFIRGDAALKLPCRHLFHKACIDPWVKLQKCCPYCRLTIKDCYFKLELHE